jgi:predicted porin
LGAYDQQGTTEVGLNYNKAPFAASVSQMKVDLAGVGTQVGNAKNATVTTMGANYTMGAVKVFGLYQTNKTDDAVVENKGMSLSATYAMGAVTLMAQVGNNENKAGAKSKLTGIGADYALSKRTALYFRSESIDDKAALMNAAVNPGSIANAGDTKFGRTAVGVRHTF